MRLEFHVIFLLVILSAIVSTIRSLLCHLFSSGLFFRCADFTMELLA